MRDHDTHPTGTRTRARVLAIALVAATCIAIAPGAAHAGETESHSLFVEGRELRKAGKCAEAITSFRRALDTYPEGLGALRNVAECEEELGRFASARRSYWDLRLAALQSTETKYAGWDKEAEEAHTRLAVKVAKVTVTFKGTRPDDLVIQFNGRTFDPRLLGVEIEQDNGQLEVAASYGAGPPVTKKVIVVTAGRHAIQFDVAELKKGPKTTTPPGERSSGDAMKIGGIVALGVGGAGLVGTGVAIAMHQSALSDLEKDCPDYDADGTLCPASTQDIKDRGTTASLLTNIFAATAIVGAGVGVTLLVLAPSDDPETGQAAPRPRARFAVTPLPGGGFFGVSGSM